MKVFFEEMASDFFFHKMLPVGFWGLFFTFDLNMNPIYIEGANDDRY